MLRKIIWVMILLIMTATTVFFKDSAQIVLGDLSPSPQSDDLSGELANPMETVPPVALDTTAEAGVNPLPPLSATPTQSFPIYVLQPGSPASLDNFANPEEGCNWQGVAGQVFDENGEPINNLVVRVSGVWNGNVISKTSVTGTPAGSPYGPGGYEIVLGNQAVDSNTPLALQVFNNDQEPLTEPLYIVTNAGCNENLLIVNFISY